MIREVLVVALLALACASSTSVVWAQASGASAPQDVPPGGDMVRPLSDAGAGPAAVPVAAPPPTFELPARTQRSALDDPTVLMVLAASAAVLVTALLGLAVLMLVRRRAAGSAAPEVAPAPTAAAQRPVAEAAAPPPPAADPGPQAAGTPPRAPPPGSPAVAGRPEARLLDAEGVTGRDSINIVADTVLLGRSKQNAQTGVQVVTIARGTVGRRHAVIEYRNHAFHLIDQGSVNGTLLNGERILAPTVLHHGDVIRLESVELTFSFPMERVAAPTVIVSAPAEEEEITRIAPTPEVVPAAASRAARGGEQAAATPLRSAGDGADETGANITIAPEFEARAERRAGLIDRYLEPTAPEAAADAPAADAEEPPAPDRHARDTDAGEGTAAGSVDMAASAVFSIAPDHEVRAARGGLIASALGMAEDEGPPGAAEPVARERERPDAPVAAHDPRAADTADEPLGSLNRLPGEASDGSDAADEEVREEASRTQMDPDVAAIFAAQSDDSLRDDDTTGPEAGFDTAPRVRSASATQDAVGAEPPVATPEPAVAAPEPPESPEARPASPVVAAPAPAPPEVTPEPPVARPAPPAAAPAPPVARSEPPAIAPEPPVARFEPPGSTPEPSEIGPEPPEDPTLAFLTAPDEVDFPPWVDADNVPADARQTGVSASAPADDGQSDVTAPGDDEDTRSTEGLLGAHSTSAERADPAEKIAAAASPASDFDHQSTRRFETPPDNRPTHPLPPPKAEATLVAEPEDSVPAPVPAPPRRRPAQPTPEPPRSQSPPAQPPPRTPAPSQSPPAQPTPRTPAPSQSPPAPSPPAARQAPPASANPPRPAPPLATRGGTAPSAAEDVTDHGGSWAGDGQSDASDESYLLDVDPTVPRVAAPPARPRAWLVDIDAVTRTPRFEVSTDVVIIGRSAPTRVTGRQYLTIRRNTIGRRHATLRYDGEHFTVEDHQSINGTYLNGERVVSVVPVPAGSEIVFDEFRFRFEVEPPGTVRDDSDEPEWDATVLFGTSEDGSRGRS